jgi:hypothetical protein
MAFTNVWDNTFPPDTQPANQYGADLRNMRLDVQQRFSSLCGLDANKPTLEAVWAGLAYTATDTGNIYRWNGASWDHVANVIPQSGQSVFPGGTAGAPSLAFLGSLLTGIYSDAADTVKVAVGGQKKFSFEAAAANFFEQPVVDATVATVDQADASGKLITTNFLKSLTESGLRYNLTATGGFVAFPKWLTGGVKQLVVKWGSLTPPTDPYIIVFDATVAFANPPTVVVGGGGASIFITSGSVTATQFSMNGNDGHPSHWIAIGTT